MANVPNKPDKKEKAIKKDAPAQKQQRKPLSPVRAALMTLVFCLLVTTAAACLLYFDFLDARQVAVFALLEGDNPYAPQLSQLEEFSADVQKQNQELETAKVEFQKSEQLMAKREKDVAAKEALVATNEAALLERTQKLETAQIDMEGLVMIYEKMDAATSAKILAEVSDVEYVVRILSGLKRETTAAILAAMDKSMAAKITELMMLG